MGFSQRAELLLVKVLQVGGELDLFNHWNLSIILPAMSHLDRTFSAGFFVLLLRGLVYNFLNQGKEQK
jgi:hypothetical protein